MSDLISSSPTMRPWVVSTRNMRPGSRRPFFTTECDGTSMTPASLAMTTSPSSVTQ